MSSSIELVCVHPKRVREIWPHVELLLRRAIARTGLSAFCDVEHDILCGNSLVWLAVAGSEGSEYAIEAAAATSLQQTEAGKVCVITACSGRRMAGWLPLIAGVEAYAANEGCRAIRIFGRKGWLRVLEGYREKHVILEKSLRSSLTNCPCSAHS